MQIDSEWRQRMLDQQNIGRLPGGTAYGPSGEKIGSVGNVYLDDATGQPEWVTVNTGLFGTNESFVPIQGADLTDDGVVLAHDKDTVKSAPNVSGDGHLEPAEEQELYRHYGLTWSSGAGDGVDSSQGHDTSGPTTDDAMTRSEERVDVGTKTEEAGRARLRKYVVTENVTQTVPVRKERAVIEREPITDANVGAATDGPAISEEEHEVVLHEERPVVQKTAEPVERVRLGTEAETSEETVSEAVRKEQIEVDGDTVER
jgi:uncharacterized protein (TIGR02271 family)